MSDVGFPRSPSSVQSGTSSASEVRSQREASTKEASTSEVADKTFVKGVAPQLQTSKDLTAKIASHRPVTSFPKLKAILNKIFPFLFKESVAAAAPKFDLKKVPQDQRSIAAARHLIASFTHKDLNTEGIFRISGNASFVKEAKAAIGKGRMPDVQQMTSENKANVVSSLLKDVEFFDDTAKQALHETTLPHLSEWAKDKEGNFADESIAFRSLATQIHSMPIEKRELLRDLVFLCDDINKNSSANKMDTSNLAMILGPRFLPFEDNSAVNLLDQNAEQQQLGNFILSLTTEQKQFLFNPQT